jgi:thiol-disulfide isomerase/thioredoxin
LKAHELNLGVFAGGALVLLALAAGLFLRFSSGRGKRVSSSEAIDLGKLKAPKGKAIAKKFGAKATLLQFSTEYCGQCPGVRRQLLEFEEQTAGLLYLDVDITDRLNLAAHFSVSQTPTVFVLDPKGEIKSRISGIPRPGVIQAELKKLGAL